MKFDTISSKVTLAGAMLFVLMAISTGTGLWVAYAYEKGVHNAVAAADVQRGVMMGDMMHDALRADSLNALIAADPVTRISTPDEVIADINEHITTFKQAIGEAKKAEENPEVLDALNKLDAPMNEYFTAASNIGAASKQSIEATRAQLPAFNQKFKGLEDAMGTTSELVEKYTEDGATSAERQSKMAEILMFVMLGAALAFVGGAIWLARKQISTPIGDITNALDRLANGDLNGDSPHSDKGGEIGQLAKAFAKFKENAIERKNLEAREALSQTEREARAKRIEELTNGFATMLADSLVTLSSTSQELQANASQLGSMAQQTEALTQEASMASNEASNGVNSIAAATTELTATVEQIAGQMEQSARIAGEASSLGNATDSSVRSLAQAVSEISAVVSLIDDVAAQTNLLALNATIEAARAGEAGKGFAVVASEVKTLAAQTASATQDITSRISSIKDASGHVEASVNGLIRMVEEMHQLSQQAATSVAEQSDATGQIAQDANMVSEGTGAATQRVNMLGESAKDASAASTSLSQAASEVAEHASRLRQSSDEFFAQLKAA